MLKVQNMKKISSILLLFLVLVSCSKQDNELTILNQESAIDKYITGSFADYRIVRNSGSNRIVINEGDSADTLAFGDSLSFYYAGYVFSSGLGTIFATNNIDIAIATSFSTTDADYTPLKVIFSNDSFTSGLRNGMLGMKENEHAYIVFSAKYGFYNTQLYNIPKLSPLIYQVWIEKIKKI